MTTSFREDSATTSRLDMQPNRLHNGTRGRDMDKVFKALADPGRRLLLDRLHADNGQTLGSFAGTWT